MSTYLGVDVLEVKHNMRDRIAESFGRRGELMDGLTGKRTFDDHGGQPFPVRNFQWTCLDRTAVNALRAFLDARKGRLNAFWVPTCCWDIQLAQDATSGSAAPTIVKAGYFDYLFPMTSRRYLGIFPPGGGAMIIRKVTACVSLDAVTEQITLLSAAGVALPSATTVICFLVLCRLAEDLTEIHWDSPTRCEASIKFVELPTEVPA